MAKWTRGRRAMVLAVLALAFVVIVLDFGAEFIAGPALLRQSRKDQLAELTSVRTMLIQAFGGLVLLAGLAYTARTFWLAEQGHITDRYTKAVEQLGSPHRAVRTGGIYALERIMRDSDRDHATIVEVLISFLQEHARPPSGRQRLTAEEQEAPSRRLRPPADVAAAIAALRRRPLREERDPLDLAGTFLIGADFQGANLKNANLRDADLRWAVLEDAQLQGVLMHRAKLRGARLKGAQLDKAHLNGASLPAAYMSKATLHGAYLADMDLTFAWLDDADLGAADLHESNLQNALLARTKIHNAKLHKTDLRGVDLRKVQGLTQEQIEVARTDSTTQLPRGLVRPRAEPADEQPTS